MLQEVMEENEMEGKVVVETTLNHSKSGYEIVERGITAIENVSKILNCALIESQLSPMRYRWKVVSANVPISDVHRKTEVLLL